jgi:hypothetical protein
MIQFAHKNKYRHLHNNTSNDKRNQNTSPQ